VLGFDAQYDVRKLVVNRFRYVLITAIVESALMVIAVAHTSRAPGYWRDRLL
jgi:cell division protein FtsL